MEIQKTKFWAYFSSLTPKEKREWLRFTKTPYFNTNKNIVRLSEFCLSKLADETKASIDKKILFNHLFPGTVYKDIKLRKLLSNSVRLIEKFWVVNSSLNNSIRFKDNLQDCLKDKSLGKYHQVEIQNLEDLIIENQESTDYHLLSRLRHERCLYPSKATLDIKLILDEVKISIETNKAANDTASLVLAHSLLQLSEYTEIHKEDFNVPFTESKSDLLDKDVGYNLLRELYTLRTANHKNIKFELEDLWREFVSQFNHCTFDIQYYFVVFIYNHVRNYRRQHLYKNDFFLKILVFAIDNKVLTYNRHGGGEAIYAYCQHLCVAGQFTLAHTLLNDYQNSLIPNIRKEVTILCKALILFHGNKVDQAYYLLQSFKIANHETCELYRRTLILKTLLSLVKNANPIAHNLPYQIDTFKKYLKRNQQFDHSVIEIYQSFANTINKAYKLIINPNSPEEQKSDFVTQLERVIYISDDTTSWLSKIVISNPSITISHSISKSLTTSTARS